MPRPHRLNEPSEPQGWAGHVAFGIFPCPRFNPLRTSCALSYADRVRGQGYAVLVSVKARAGAHLPHLTAALKDRASINAASRGSYVTCTTPSASLSPLPHASPNLFLLPTKIHAMTPHTFHELAGHCPGRVDPRRRGRVLGHLDPGRSLVPLSHLSPWCPFLKARPLYTTSSCRRGFLLLWWATGGQVIGSAPSYCWP